MSAVLFTTHELGDGKQLVEMRLNAERSLNALSMEMIDALNAKLDEVEHDDRVVALLLDSVGEKAFCAGGDIVNLYKSCTEADEPTFAQDFFIKEYGLDYRIHQFPKPIIAWGAGIVMGGGQGILNGCSHRVVTESTMFAMPETAIGLFPDVGGGWFLNKTPGNTGLFVGLTGARLNANDMAFMGLADRLITNAHRAGLIDQLAAADWSGDPHLTITTLLRALALESRDTFAQMPSPVRERFDEIQQLTDTNTIAEFVAQFGQLETEDEWLQKVQKGLSKASPLSLVLFDQYMRVTEKYSLKEVLMTDLVISTQSLQQREFPEGIRALLIDKDGKPDWTYKSVEAVDPAFVDGLFVAPWPENPLKAM